LLGGLGNPENETEVENTEIGKILSLGMGLWICVGIRGF
jgi:hypothetical protein